MGEDGLALCERLFWAWEIYRHTSDRDDLKATIGQVKRELKQILKRCAGKAARYRHTRRFANNLLKIWPALWTFATRAGTQPTNNHAERGLRRAVNYRKLSLGSQSQTGERHTARLLFAHITCRLQRRSLHAHLSDLLSAHARGDPAPLLT